MDSRGQKSAALAGLACALLMCTGSVLAAMKIASATLNVPEDDKPILLAGLSYRGEWLVEFTSIRLDRDQRDDADPLQHIFTLTANSSRPMVQKVVVEIDLLDSSGKKIKSVKKFIVVKSATDNQDFPVKMKVKRPAWARAKNIRIKTTFAVL